MALNDGMIGKSVFAITIKINNQATQRNGNLIFTTDGLADLSISARLCDVCFWCSSL